MNGIAAIIQGSFILVITKNLLKRSSIFFKVGDLAKCLIKESPIVVLYYVLLWVFAKINK